MKDKKKKEALRNQLFAKYFEEEGILVTDFLDKLSFIASAWQDLRELCAKNMKYFFQGKSLEKIRIVQSKGRKYLILKLLVEEYVVIDVEKKENISKIDFQESFEESFFIKHFDEEKRNDENDFIRHCMLIKYYGDMNELINFYLKNQNILELNNQIVYKYEIGEAWTYFSVNFTNQDIQIGFRTPDQFLYETLHFNYNLLPYSVQEDKIISAIGKERMQEMFKEIPKIKIPENLIPEDLLQAYRNQKENLKRDLIIKKD